VTEEKRLLITKIERGETEEGSKPVIEMYEANPRLKWPTLRLFDLSALFEVGIDPNDLALGEERVVRFYAFYVESDRTNQAGNAYRDITRLEAIETKSRSGVEQKLDTIADLLKGIDRRLASIHQVTEVIASETLQLANATPDATPENWPGDDEPEVKPEETLGPAEEDTLASQPQANEQPAPEVGPGSIPKTDSEEDAPVLSEDMARRRFGKLAGPGIRAGELDSSIPGRLTAQVSAGALGWRDALQQLEAAIAEQV